MKTVVLIRSNPVSPDPPVEKMANTLLKIGYNVKIVAWDRDGCYDLKETELRLHDGIVHVIRFGIPAQFSGGIKKTMKQFLKFQIQLKKWLLRNRESFDIIHAFDFDTGFTAFRCAKKLRKIFIYHILDYYIESHGLSGSKLGYIVKRSENRLINKSEATIICSEKRKEQISGTVPKRLVIIHNTPQQICSNVKIHKKTEILEIIKIVYVGILGEGRFIKETARFVSSDNRFEFHIGGFGCLEEELYSVVKGRENIYFYGKLTYEQTLSLERDCDIMIAIYDPSVSNHRYAAPNKFYESLMLGKPIIMAKNTGFDEIIEQNNIGYLIEYREDALIKGLKKLLNQKESWSEMSKRSKTLYEEKYSWIIMEKRITDLYDEIIKSS